MIRVWLFVDNELYPATWAMQADSTARDVGQAGELVDLPDELAERALSAWREFRMVAEELRSFRAGNRPVTRSVAPPP